MAERESGEGRGERDRMKYNNMEEEDRMYAPAPEKQRTGRKGVPRQAGNPRIRPGRENRYEKKPT
jgi:hypothetical protein